MDAGLFSIVLPRPVHLTFVQCCVMLLRSGAEVDLKDQSGMTAMLLAAKYEYEDVMKVLLK
jgi:ankyrin repeat protein